MHRPHISRREDKSTPLKVTINVTFMIYKKRFEENSKLFEQPLSSVYQQMQEPLLKMYFHSKFTKSITKAYIGTYAHQSYQNCCIFFLQYLCIFLVGKVTWFIFGVQLVPIEFNIKSPRISRAQSRIENRSSKSIQTDTYRVSGFTRLIAIAFVVSFFSFFIASCAYETSSFRIGVIPFDYPECNSEVIRIPPLLKIDVRWVRALCESEYHRRSIAREFQAREPNCFERPRVEYI